MTNIIQYLFGQYNDSMCSKGVLNLQSKHFSFILSFEVCRQTYKSYKTLAIWVLRACNGNFKFTLLLYMFSFSVSAKMLICSDTFDTSETSITFFAFSVDSVMLFF